MFQSRLPLHLFSRNVETADCGESPDGVVAEGIANAPFGKRALRIATEIGLTSAACAGVRPNAAASPAAVRLLSVNCGGMKGNVRLLLSEAPLRSRGP